MKTLEEKTTPAIRLENYIEKLPYNNCILKIEATKPNFASGKGTINNGGDYSFEITAKADLRFYEAGTLVEGNYQSDFGITNYKVSLKRIIDRNGMYILFSKTDRGTLETAIHRQLIFDIIKKF